MSRPGNIDMQFQLNGTFKSHFEMFPVFQEYFRKHQPPALIIWGKHDVFFDVAEASCYKRDLPEAQIHILDGGHMAGREDTNHDIRFFSQHCRKPSVVICQAHIFLCNFLLL